MDRRFRPHNRVKLDYPSHREHSRVLVNTETGRVHIRDIPMLRRYFVISITTDGLLVLAAKEAPGGTSEDALDYSSASCSNYYDDNGDLISGGFVFLIPGQFQPAAYYDILIDGYVEDLEQAEIIEIPVEE